MKNFFLNIEKNIPLMIQMALLVFFGVIFFIDQIEGYSRILLLLARSFTIILGLASVILLIISKKTLLAYITLYFLYFSERLFALFRAIFSYNFKFEMFGTTPDLMMIIYAAIEIYLVIMIVAHLFKEKLTLNYQSHQTWIIFFIFVAYYLVFYGLNALIPIGVIVLLLMLSKEYLIALLIILSCYIATPFVTIDRLLLGNFGGFSIIFYIRQFLEICVVAGLGFYIIQLSGLFYQTKKS
jgi:hypothetical protein